MNADFLNSYDGTRLRTRTWLTHQTAKANVIFCHGLFEYAGRYDYEAEIFNNAGYNFYSYDQRTHGESEGERRSYIKSFDPFIEDYRFMVEHYMQSFDKPFILFSHSMGCTVMLTYLLKEKLTSPLFKGVILSGPFIKPIGHMNPLLQRIAKIVSWVSPTFRTIKARPNTISSDPEEVRKYVNDPYVYTDGMYAVTAYQMLYHSAWLQKQLQKFDHPFLVMHGTNDKLAAPEGSELLYNLSPSTDKTHKPLKGLKHEITREIERDKVLNAMVEWADQRVVNETS